MTTDTLCVVATHWGGALADIQAIRDIVSAVSPDVFLIEDAAQAFGATSRGMPVGLAGDIGVFSFAAGKGLTLFEGGAVVSRSARTAAGLRETAAQLLLPDMKWEVRRTMELAAYTLLYRPLGLYFAHGLPKRYWMSRGEMAKALGDEFSSIALHRVGSWRKSFGARALRRLPEHVAATRERFTRLSARLGAIPGVRVQSPRPGEAPSGTYVLATLADPARADAVLRQGTRLGLGISRLFAFPLDRYGSLAGLLRPADLAISSDMASRSVTVGTSTLMSQAEEDRIVRLFADHATP